MISKTFSAKFDRRTLVKGVAALGAFQVASPFIIQARGETPIRIGMVDPLTGVYAAPAGNEVMEPGSPSTRLTPRVAFSDVRSNYWWKIPPMMSAPACKRPAS